MLLAGKDAYVEYGAKIFNKKAERGPGEDQVTEKLRKIAKIPTLGTSYGMTPYGFIRQIRDELGIEYSIEESEGFFATFFELFPGIAAYHTRAEEEAAYRVDVRTIAGTRRWLPALIGEPGDDWELNKEYDRSLRYRKNVLLNTPIQGSGADLVIWAVNQFMPQLSSEAQVINLVHDEVDLLVTKETLNRTVKLIATAFRETFAKFYPESPLLPSIKFSAGPSWGELAALGSE
jgi:DNA polymerase-1